MFVDLKKAYDSAHRELLWLVLGKLGVPSSVIKLLQSFHIGMKARISINGKLLDDEVEVGNSLRQGCTQAGVHPSSHPFQPVCLSVTREVDSTSCCT